MKVVAVQNASKESSTTYQHSRLYEHKRRTGRALESPRNPSWSWTVHNIVTMSEGTITWYCCMQKGPCRVDQVEVVYFMLRYQRVLLFRFLDVIYGYQRWRLRCHRPLYSSSSGWQTARYLVGRSTATMLRHRVVDIEVWALLSKESHLAMVKVWIQVSKRRRLTRNRETSRELNNKKS